MRAYSLAVLVTLLFAASAGAQLSSDYVDWADGPVKFLMTADDIAKWKAITNDNEAQAFIDLFWARRDPTPSTPENEWRNEFETRAALADEHFATAKTHGSMTDRGRVLILLGSPAEVASRGAEARSQNSVSPEPGSPWSSGQVELPSTLARGARQVWTYSGEKKPSFVRDKVLELTFSDDTGRGDWQLATTERVNPNFVLSEAVSALIFSPDLTAIPAYAETTAPPIPTSFDDPSLQAAYDEFRSGDTKLLGSANLTWGEFVTSEGKSFAAVQLYFPASSGFDAGRNVTFIGVIEDEAGNILDLHAKPATLIASVRDAFVDDSFVLSPGQYRATFGVAENGKVLAMTATDLTILGIDPAATGISQLILSNHAYPIPEGQLATDPYAFGGLKFAPKGDSTFSTTDDLWYFFELRNPGLSEAGTPKMNVKVNFDGKAAGTGEAVRFELPFREVETIKLKGLDGRYGLGMSFPLKDFKPGQYTVKIRVIDTVLRASYDFERALEVR